MYDEEQEDEEQVLSSEQAILRSLESLTRFSPCEQRDIAAILAKEGFIKPKRNLRSWILGKIAKGIEDDMGTGENIAITQEYYDGLREGKYCYGVTRAIDDILATLCPEPFSQRIDKAQDSPEAAWEFIQSCTDEDFKKIPLNDLYPITKQVRHYKPK